MIEILFWLLVGIVAYVHFGYSLLLTIIGQCDLFLRKKENDIGLLSMGNGWFCAVRRGEFTTRFTALSTTTSMSVLNRLTWRAR